jgi:hypothetical protein
MSTIHGTTKFGLATARRQYYSPLEAYWKAFREWRKRERLRTQLCRLTDGELMDIEPDYRPARFSFLSTRYTSAIGALTDRYDRRSVCKQATSAFGPFRTLRDARLESALGGRAEVTFRFGQRGRNGYSRRSA